MKERDTGNSHISSKLHMIYIPSNNDRHPVTKTFTPLHSTTLDTSLFPIETSPNHTSLYFTTLSFVLSPFKFPNAPFRGARWRSG